MDYRTKILSVLPPLSPISGSVTNKKHFFAASLIAKRFFFVKTAMTMTQEKTINTNRPSYSARI